MTSLRRTLRLIQRGAGSFVFGRPLCVSFEVTYCCNARCKHCHLGGIVKDEERAAPERFGEMCRMLKPVVAQISGGEPLMRRDLEDIIQNLRKPDSAPYVVVTTNGIMLSRKRLQSLCNAGVDAYSLSLDYPDERHNEFRGVSRLFERIEKLIHELDAKERKTITLSCVVQRDNFRDLIALVRLAKKWDVRINFSTYTWLRTQDKDYVLSGDEINELRDIIAHLLTDKKIFSSHYVFERMAKFFENEGIENCLAGRKFLIVNPDGTLSPCGLIIKKYDNQRDIIQDFCRSNDCVACNTSIRANSEKPLLYLLRDNLRALFG
jgi:MoaA/NifB/PqqE/SkfB family radical SAM enzyme